jgi:5-hydroxyisourate hydrolase
MSQLTTHVLDTAKGKPAEGVAVILLQQQGEGWKQMSLKTTDSNGRISDLLNEEVVLEPGSYRLRFDIKSYYEFAGTPSFYPFVEITFNISGPEHYHIPLLISPFGYSTYRGS